MRLKSIEIRNYRAIGDLKHEFKPGVTGVVGKNGAGKSSFMSALMFLLSGDPMGDDKKKDVLRWGTTKGHVRGVLELGSDLYTVTRHLQNTQVDVEGPGDWSRAGRAEVDEFILGAMGGISKPVLERIVMVAQGKTKALLECRPSERVSAFLEAFGLEEAEKLRGVYEMELRDLPKVDYKELRAKAASHRNMAGLDLEQASKLAPELKKAEAGLDAALASLVGSGGRPRSIVLASLESAKSRKNKLEEEIRLYSELADASPSKADLLRYRDLVRDINRLQASLEKDNRELSSLRKVEGTPQDVLEEGLESLRVLAPKAEYAGQARETGECPVCHQAVDKADFEGIPPYDKVRRDLAATERRIQEAKLAMAQSDAVGARIKATEADMATRRGELEGLGPLEGVETSGEAYLDKAASLKLSIPDLDARITVLTEELPNAVDDDAVKAREAATSEVSRLRGVVGGIRASEAAALERAESMIKRAAELELEAASGESSSDRVELLTRAREVLHRDKLPKLAALSKVKSVSSMMSDYLEKMGFPYQVAITDDLEVMYQSEGGERPFLALSGGQKMVVSIALRMALVDSMASAAYLLALDEPTDGMDADAKSGLADVIGKVGDLARGRGMTILLSTHEDDLKRVLGETVEF